MLLVSLVLMISFIQQKDAASQYLKVVGKKEATFACGPILGLLTARLSKNLEEFEKVKV